jgi:hypothetical protein
MQSSATTLSSARTKSSAPPSLRSRCPLLHYVDGVICYAKEEDIRFSTTPLRGRMGSFASIRPSVREAVKWRRGEVEKRSSGLDVRFSTTWMVSFATQRRVQRRRTLSRRTYFAKRVHSTTLKRNKKLNHAD